MNKKRYLFLIVLLSVSGATCLGQFHLPSLDVQVKSGAAALIDMQDYYNNQYAYVAPIISGEVNWNISQYLAAGVFVSKGVSSNTKFTGEFGSGNTSYPSMHYAYGLKLRISSGRQPKYRPFAEISYGKFEMYMQKESYKVSNDTKAFGFSGGLMVSLTGKLYLVLPQITLRFRSEPFFFESSNDYLFGIAHVPFLEVTGGLSYNIGKKK